MGTLGDQYLTIPSLSAMIIIGIATISNLFVKTIFLYNASFVKEWAGHVFCRPTGGKWLLYLYRHMSY